MDQLIALFREQAAVLAAVAGNATAVPAATVSPAAAAPAAVTVDPGQVAATVRAEAARICGFPTDLMLDTQTLTGDLGFDSIMLADLAAGSARRFPSSPSPREPGRGRRRWAS